MHRTVLTTALLTTIGVVATGASTCGPLGPAARDFAAGSLVIPMDNCYQRRDGGAGTSPCNATSDDGVFRAYGVVYFLLKNNITVYWAIDNTKTDPRNADITAPAVTGGYAAQHMRWSDGTFPDNVGAVNAAIAYDGGPFVIDAADAARAVDLFTNSADFARLKNDTANVIDIHKVASGFHATQVRTLTGPPPKLAILNINPVPYHKTSLDVMYKYAVAAGLDDPTCNGIDNCAGGLGASCDANVVQKYLNNTLCPSGCSTSTCSTCNPNWVSPSITTAKFNRPGNAGKIFDILCDGDFIPPTGGTYADTYLAKGGYKLIWAPHWDTAGTDPLGASAASVALKAQLDTLASFVDAGNNLFAECLAIGSLEGGGGEKGLAATRFQTTAGMLDTTGSGNSAFALAAFPSPAEPNVQIGDFSYPGSAVDGAITTYHPDNAPTSPQSTYLPAVKRLIFGTAGNKPGNTCSPACGAGQVCWDGRCVQATPWDVATTIQVAGPDGAQRGTVAYLGGHDYSPNVNNSPGSTGQTAGTRIVLNTLFNLGFGCADPNTTCTTGLLGACAQGTLRCAGGGGLQCTGPQPGALDCNTPGADANCNGIPDANEQGCQPVACAEGATQTCYEGPAGTAGVGKCKAGQRTCTGGLWGPCAGQVLPQPEVCNGADDNCDGQKDEGALCATGYSCQSGLCLPAACNNESARCPTGFQCLTSGGACTGVPCGASNTTCPAGQVCQSGACVDPCAGVKCGPGAGCSGGQCVAGGCALTGCSGAGQVCVGGTCVADPCAGSSCPEGTFCRVGPQVNGAFVADCVRSCSYVGCPAGQTCDEDGFCESPCAAPCAQGQICVAGACASDPCAGVTCGAGQQCQGGTCVDSACKNIKCPIGQCVAGQCMNGGLTTSQPTPIKAASSGGCGTGGNADLAALLLVAVALASRRRSFVPALARAARRAAPLALAILLALGSACSKSGDPSCQAPQTACGADCVDLATSTLHCGACGHGCASGFQCLAGTCTFPTGNPHLVSASPSTLGLGASPALELSFDGLAQQPSTMAVRLTGAVKAQELPVTVSGGKATLPAQSIDLTGEVSGTSIEVRLLNMPGRLVSNALQIAVVDALVARTLTPALARQDTPGEVPLTLQGLGFVSGATIAFKNAATGATQVLTPTAVTATQIQFTPPPPSTLAVGRYEVAVTNPGGASSSPVAFTVTEGAPLLDGVTGTRGTCVQAGGPFSGTAQGRFVYPSSVVHVSGNSISNSPLDTSCLSGTDALGQCVGGQLRVTADLSAVPSGTYDVTIWNPGATGALKSAPLQITVAPSCP